MSRKLSWLAVPLEHLGRASIAQLLSGKLQQPWALPLTPSPIHVGTGRTELTAQ